VGPLLGRLKRRRRREEKNREALFVGTFSGRRLVSHLDAGAGDEALPANYYSTD